MPNLFTSPEWLQRAEAINVNQQGWNLKRHWGLRILRPEFADLTDYEQWPLRNVIQQSQPHADVIIYRKLLHQLKPTELPKGALIWQDSATFKLDLNQPLNIKKEVLYHLGRTERKLRREWGEIEISEANDLTKDAWFAGWFHHLSRRYPESPLVETQNQIMLKRWLLDLPLPSWIKLYSMRVGEHTLAWSLCYSWKSVVYSFAPIMTTVPEFSKYGPGKLLTQKIIEKVKAEKFEIFDFLQGEHSYKLDWGPERIPLYACLVPITVFGSLAAQYLMLGKK